MTKKELIKFVLQWGQFMTINCTIVLGHLLIYFFNNLHLAIMCVVAFPSVIILVMYLWLKKQGIDFNGRLYPH